MKKEQLRRKKGMDLYFDLHFVGRILERYWYSYLQYTIPSVSSYPFPRTPGLPKHLGGIVET